MIEPELAEIFPIIQHYFAMRILELGSRYSSFTYGLALYFIPQAQYFRCFSFCHLLVKPTLWPFAEVTRCATTSTTSSPEGCSGYCHRCDGGQSSEYDCLWLWWGWVISPYHIYASFAIVLRIILPIKRWKITIKPIGAIYYQKNSKISDWIFVALAKMRVHTCFFCSSPVYVSNCYILISAWSWRMSSTLLLITDHVRQERCERISILSEQMP